MRVDVRPEMLRWARQRSGVAPDDLARRFPRLDEWENGVRKPTLKQLEDLAKATFTPFGYFLLASPPIEQIPLPDFRRISNAHRAQPSPNLLETVYLCQQRQEWYHDFAVLEGESRRDFVGSANLNESPETVAARMRRELSMDLDARRACPTWVEALRQFITQADDLGALVMCSGVVRNNTHRKLDPDEFRGFAISDEMAPLVFINGADTKSAQMFTLAHELAHLWLGRTALSDIDPSVLPDNDVERWCNQVAAEVLVPLDAMRADLRAAGDLAREVQQHARNFKVSTLVVLRRMYDANHLSRDEFFEAYSDERARLRDLPKSSGGDFYLSLASRVSKRFARAIVTSTIEGRTLYRDAFQLLGVPGGASFDRLTVTLGFGS